MAAAARPGPDDHPIYGVGGIMYGIRFPGYSIDPTYPKVDPKQFGNNGLVVGQWWPKQAATVRDGAHGKETRPVNH